MYLYRGQARLSSTVNLRHQPSGITVGTWLIVCHSGGARGGGRPLLAGGIGA